MVLSSSCLRSISADISSMFLASASMASLRAVISPLFFSTLSLFVLFSSSYLSAASLRFFVCSPVRTRSPSFLSISPLSPAIALFSSPLSASRAATAFFMPDASPASSSSLLSFSSITAELFSIRAFIFSASSSSLFPFMAKRAMSASFISS